MLVEAGSVEKGHGRAPWEGKGVVRVQEPWEGKGVARVEEPWEGKGVVRAQERAEGSPPEVRANPCVLRGLGSPVEGVLLEESPVVEEVDVSVAPLAFLVDWKNRIVPAKRYPNQFYTLHQHLRLPSVTMLPIQKKTEEASKYHDATIYLLTEYMRSFGGYDHTLWKADMGVAPTFRRTSTTDRWQFRDATRSASSSFVWTLAPALTRTSTTGRWPVSDAQRSA